MPYPKKAASLLMILGGAGLILAGELSILFKIEPLTVWVTPLCWTGYIFLLDGILFLWKKQSPLWEGPTRFFWTFPVSTALWLVFEGYNLLLKNWEYVNLPTHPLVRYPGYVWAFSTILPALLETNRFLEESGFFRKVPLLPKPIPSWGLSFSFWVGVVLTVYPLLSRTPADVPAVWLCFIFLLEPIVYRGGGASLLKEMEQGRTQRFFTLMVAGLWMGLLWEFWNYWAGVKWVYQIPYPTPFYIFEMPFTGFFGFLPFGIEFYVMYQTALLFFQRLRRA